MPGLRSALAAGRSCLGTYVTLPSPEIVEIFGYSGFDYVILDLQHSTPDWATLASMIRAAELSGLSAVVRVPDYDTARILRLLELGAEGIALPGISNADDLKRVADACYYRPLGTRGSCGHTRVGRYNPNRAEFRAHTQQQNERVFVWALVEEPKALLAIDELVSITPGPAVISVGRGDLSAALGHPGNINHPEVIAATVATIAKVDAASSGRCSSAVMVHSRQDIEFWFARGARMFTYSADAPLLTDLARGLAAGFRSAIPQR